MKSGVTFLRVSHTCACGCAYARVFAYACVIVRDAGSSSIVAGRVCRKFDATRVASRCMIQIDIVTGRIMVRLNTKLPMKSIFNRTAKFGRCRSSFDELGPPKR